MPQISKTQISDLTCRVLKLIESKTSGSRHLKKMEEFTGVSSERWKAISGKKQNVTIEIFEIVCKTWPQHAFWLATGEEDEEAGHSSPKYGEYETAAVRGTFFDEVEFFSSELLRLKVKNAYDPDRLSLLFQPSDGDEDGIKNPFAHRFNSDGEISTSEIDVELLGWLTCTEKDRPIYELNRWRVDAMTRQEVRTRRRETFFSAFKGEKTARLIEPYLSQVLRLKAATELKFEDDLKLKLKAKEELAAVEKFAHLHGENHTKNDASSKNITEIYDDLSNSEEGTSESYQKSLAALQASLVKKKTKKK